MLKVENRLATWYSQVWTVQHDPTYIASNVAVDTNCEELLKSLDPLSFALKLVSRGLISSQQAQDVLNDQVKTKSESNLACLNLIKSSSHPT